MDTPKSDRSFLEHLDKILFGVACSYLILVVLWLVSQNQLFSSQAQKTPKRTLSTEDAQFIAYLQQSLNVIEKKSDSQTPANPTPLLTPLAQPFPFLLKSLNGSIFPPLLPKHPPLLLLGRRYPLFPFLPSLCLAFLLLPLYRLLLLRESLLPPQLSPFPLYPYKPPQNPFLVVILAMN